MASSEGDNESDCSRVNEADSDALSVMLSDGERVISNEVEIEFDPERELDTERDADTLNEKEVLWDAEAEALSVGVWDSLIVIDEECVGSDDSDVELVRSRVSEPVVERLSLALKDGLNEGLSDGVVDSDAVTESLPDDEIDSVIVSLIDCDCDASAVILLVAVGLLEGERDAVSSTVRELDVVTDGVSVRESVTEALGVILSVGVRAVVTVWEELSEALSDTDGESDLDSLSVREDDKVGSTESETESVGLGEILSEADGTEEGEMVADGSAENDTLLESDDERLSEGLVLSEVVDETLGESLNEADRDND